MTPRHLLLPSALLFLAACGQPAETPEASTSAMDTVRTAAPVDSMNNTYEKREVDQVQRDTAAVPQ